MENLRQTLHIYVVGLISTWHIVEDKYLQLCIGERLIKIIIVLDYVITFSFECQQCVQSNGYFF